MDVERKYKGDSISACRELQVEGAKSKVRGRKTWNECGKVYMKSLGLVKDDAWNQDQFDIWKPFNTASVW